MGWLESFSESLWVALPILVLLTPPLLILVALQIRIKRRIRQWQRPGVARPPAEPVVEDSNPYRVIDA